MKFCNEILYYWRTDGGREPITLRQRALNVTYPTEACLKCPRIPFPPTMTPSLRLPPLLFSLQFPLRIKYFSVPLVNRSRDRTKSKAAATPRSMCRLLSSLARIYVGGSVARSLG